MQHVKLVHWNSLHSKKAILTTFLGQTPYFLGENHNNQILQHAPLKSWVRCNFFEPKGGVLHIQEVVQYFLQCGSSQIYTARQGLICDRLRGADVKTNSQKDNKKKDR